MHKQIYVNLPCKDLAASKAFFEAIGYSFNPHFINEKGAGLILGENLYAMLLAEDFARTFTPKAFIDSKTSTGGWVCLSCESREEVDAIVAKAEAAGGHIPGKAEDHGFMHGHRFEDLDGHHWEPVHMSGMPPQA